MPLKLTAEPTGANAARGIIIVGSCVFLIGLDVTILTRPQAARRFLEAFASSARAHYSEQLARLIVGAAMIRFAPSMWHADLFRLFGWVLTVTALGLLLIPWQWHHRFGTWVIPLAVRHMRWLAIGSLALGTFLLYGASRGLLS